MKLWWVRVDPVISVEDKRSREMAGFSTRENEDQMLLSVAHLHPVLAFTLTIQLV